MHLRSTKTVLSRSILLKGMMQSSLSSFWTMHRSVTTNLQAFEALKKPKRAKRQFMSPWPSQNLTKANLEVH